MTDYRLFLFTLLLILTGGLQPGIKTGSPNGPYHGSFIAGGVGLKKPLDAQTSPLEGVRAWSLYAWIKSDEPLTRTLLTGFGDPAGEAGTQRYFAVRAGKVSFWTGASEMQTETPLRPGSWQFLTATFEAGNLILYSDGVQLASGKLELKAAAPFMHLAPVPALFWPDAAHFAGRIADLTLLPRALMPEEVRTLSAQTRDFERIAFEAASKPWPVQTKGQDGLRVNGVRIACRGGNWGLDDSRKRISRTRLEPYFRLHREANLNMIRNWSGQNTEELFYELADEYGLLVWNDFWLSTQDWNLDPTDSALFLSNARDTISRFRHHPSIAIWCGRNEGVPSPAINEGLGALIRQLDGTRYYSPNSRHINLAESGPWHYSDLFKFFTTRGRGFSTELGLPSPPPADTIRSMLAPADHWPPNDVWAYHDWHAKSGGDTAQFIKAMNDELGAPASLEDFERKSQLLNYASHRAMFEGFNANLWRPNSGRLMWMTHPAWPSMAWQMYSSDYTTYGAFYGIKKACEPLHVQFNLPNLETAVANITTRAFPNLRLVARIFSVGGVELKTREEKVSAAANATTESFRLELPQEAAEGVAFVKLELKDEAGRVLAENFYWHASQAAGYRRLNDMRAAAVECSAMQTRERGMVRVSVELANRSGSVALALQATLRDARKHARVLPAYADDNFISLLPGERRRLNIEAPASVGSGGMEVALTGWNVQSLSVPVRRSP
jgi:Exo-beta-D-glucosaminidase Ig-fold domain/Concanavalin A-like lectin/glucanases superfamily/Glycosyl hydrolases family 2, TIM barrel domain